MVDLVISSVAGPIRLGMAALVLAAGIGVPQVAAQTAKDIVRDLTARAPPFGTSRSLKGSPAASRTLTVDEKQAVDALRASRAITIRERQKIEVIVEERPSTDLVVHFDYDSAVVGPQAEPILQELGKALESKELRGATILLAGHTDAKGTDEYNQTLSERRAAAVRLYLIRNFKVAQERVLTIGFGEGKLKNAADPYAAENRRVQVVNMPSY